MILNYVDCKAIRPSSLSYRPSNNRLFMVTAFSIILWSGLSFLAFRTLPNVTESYSERDIHSVVLSHSSYEKDRSYGLSMPTITENYNGYVSISTPYNIVHSLTTRFMIGQQNQPILARARYLLFETFCYPTILYQSILPENYSWFILADPAIDPTVIADLRALLSFDKFPEGNAYLLLTDDPSWAADGVGVPNVTSYGAGFQEIAQAVRDGKVKLLTGDADRLTRTLEYSIEGKIDGRNNTIKNTNKPLLVIETMLDADDGLNNNAIEWIQNLAVSHIQQQQELATNIRDKTPDDHHVSTLNNSWFLLCGTDHIEWHNRDIFRLTDSEYRETGLTSGIAGIRHAPQYCTSAGFTRVGLTTTTTRMMGKSTNSNNSQQKTLVFPEVAYSNHALATENFDLCNVIDSAEGSATGQEVKSVVMARCFRRDFSGLPFILKSRSITSDSMDHMDPKRKDYRDLPWEKKMDHPLLINETEKIWRILEDDFSINRFKAWETSIYLRDNLESIIEENKNSRCAPGFPCREVADVTFKKMSAYLKHMKKVNEVEATKKIITK
mmetsp:Transcript_27497/g.30856  ORF Transcript_27497/g.30856 Transcript_27497/m.30856 type:complete len:554 (-) Transcript_27497:78-1739(-)